jgi:membrane associated rhomboid family serine protease
VQATIGSHCLECAKEARPDIGTRAKFWSASQPALVTMSLIAINAVVFVMTTVSDPGSLAGRATSLHARLALWGPAVAAGEDYRLITYGFVHYGIIHIGFNMYLLYLLGQMLEPVIGRIRFALVYLAGLLGGAAGALWLQPNALTAGASGAIFGLIALAFVGYWLHGTNPLSTGIGTLLVLNLALTFFLSDRISVGGHIGGVVAGAICAFAVMSPGYKGVPNWVSYAVPIGVSALCAVIALQVV